MSLFDVMALALIAGGLVTGFLFGIDQGLWSGLLGAAIGAAKGFAIYAGTVLLILILLRLGLWYRPSFPRCKNGKCSHWDYKYLSFIGTDPIPEDVTLPKDATGLLARCGCGTVYLRDSERGQVWEVLEDGKLVPFMHHRPLGRWRAGRN